MAGVLRSCGQNISSIDSLISFLVVATGELCEKISDLLLQSAKERERCVVVHRCESIVQVLRHKLDPSVDFIIFAFDGRVAQPLSEVEGNINLIDEHYPVTGRTILLHCNGVPNILAPSYHKARTVCEKFNLRFMSSNVYDPHSCKLIGNRILNLAEAVLGFGSGIPSLS